MIYHFMQPLLKQSLKPYEITNKKEEVIGSIQRFYQNKLQRWIDFFVDGFFLHIKVHGKDSAIKVQAIQDFTLIKDRWEIHESNQIHILKDITKIKTNPRYSFFYKGKEYLIYKDYLDKFIRIKEVHSNKIISEFEYKTITPPRKVSITILDPVLDLYLSSCLYTLISIKY
ncbi:hypothetical protein [Neobacillus niacini]|uniref:tubby C-terminal domain-like protein n=1 Tax=Neobacillus niacini TaxID=86668 RepID=UPI00285D7336|nr:hypothetical protein [Neobacillus niacini]MDR6999446.1 hypothetical protein [Neobacillus niacini]